MGPKPHPLHTVEFVASCLVMTGRYPGDRRTGRTTALALQYIAKAIQEPRKWHEPKDHHDSLMMREHLTALCRDMVNKLGLEGFVFRKGAMTFGLPD